MLIAPYIPLEARASQTACHCDPPQIGAAAIREELRTLGLTPLPSVRTIARILKRAGLTNPSLRLARSLAQSDYPSPQAQDSNRVHQADVVGPRYLKGDKTPYYFLTCKDILDQAVYLELVKGHNMDGTLTFPIHSWQHLGLPEMVRLDNGRKFCSSCVQRVVCQTPVC